MITDINTIKRETARILNLTDAYFPIGEAQMDKTLPLGAEGIIIVSGKDARELLVGVLKAVKPLVRQPLEGLVVFIECGFLRMGDLNDIELVLSLLETSSYRKGLHITGKPEAEGRVTILFRRGGRSDKQKGKCRRLRPEEDIFLRFMWPTPAVRKALSIYEGRQEETDAQDIIGPIEISDDFQNAATD